MVTGIRASQRTSIETKRAATTIVDVISADQIGVLPDATVYWSNERLEVRTAYRYRAHYFKPVEPTGSAANRYVDDGGFLDASIRYNITRNIDVMAQATNITNEPQVMFRPVEGQVAQTEYSGRTYYLGAHFHY